MGEIVRRLVDFNKLRGRKSFVSVSDSGKKVRFTADINRWFTSKPCKITEKRHISHCMFDSAWEVSCDVAGRERNYRKTTV
jgi:type III restriction enzyme